jgi:hypothetical protein
VLTILFGWFPIALNLWAVLGITVYYGSLSALGYYCLSWSHYKALWLSNISSVIFFYPYLRNSFLTPIKQARSCWASAPTPDSLSCKSPPCLLPHGHSNGFYTTSSVRTPRPVWCSWCRCCSRHRAA